MANVRLFACLTCGKAWKLPLYKGAMEHVQIKDTDPVIPAGMQPGEWLVTPAHDVLLEELVRKHSMVQGHKTRVAEIEGDIPDSFEFNTEAGTQQIKILELAEELRYDAGVCFNKHGRPADGCIDYKDDSKCIGRKNVPKEARHYLCQYCPVHSFVQVMERHKRGMYK